MTENVKKNPENQSILLPNSQGNTNANQSANQKLIITSMNVPKVQNTKLFLPVTLPPTMSSKGPVINFQIANGQLQNDPQGNITVMRDTSTVEDSEMPPLPSMNITINGSESVSPPVVAGNEIIKSENGYPISIPGSRAEPTGEQEYTLSIPETTASMNDDIYTVSIADEEGGQTTETSFTLAIPEKGKSLLNKNIIERDGIPNVIIPAPAILRRSYSDNSERGAVNMSLKRRISLCTENMLNRNVRLSVPFHRYDAKGYNDDHRVPSLFCDEKMDKDLEAKVTISYSTNYKENNFKTDHISHQDYDNNQHMLKRERKSTDSEDTPGLMWNNGIAMLQGSEIQFQTNEFGLIDLVNQSDNDTNESNETMKFVTPKKEVLEGSAKENKQTSPDDMYRCEICGCHGMAAEFVTPNYCSFSCQNDGRIIQKKREKERLDSLKRKNKVKKSLIKKLPSESDMLYEKDEKLLLKQYDSMPSDSRLSNEDIENEKYPWMCGKNGFSWMKYLDHCKAKAAPVKLFKDPFPYNKNGFKVGMRMEAIDPSHPSLFCVVSVAEVQGYRMRLHFDDYPDIYDYWVNADSQDIFPAGWCEKNGRTLKPPSSCNPATFAWPFYLRQMKAVAAQKPLFPHINSSVSIFIYTVC